MCMENGQDPMAVGEKVGSGLAGLVREDGLLRGPRKFGWGKPQEGPGGALGVGSGRRRQKPEPGPHPCILVTAPGSGRELCCGGLGAKDLVESALLLFLSVPLLG